MDRYITGNTIKKLREKNKLTQNELAEKLSVSNKAVSKWETGKGYPDIVLIEDIAKVFNVSITELFSGDTIENTNICSNMEKIKFYVCPVCGNVISSTGEMSVSCHGINLSPLAKIKLDKNKRYIKSFKDIDISIVENEYYVCVKHEMTKSHYILFIAAVSSDKIELKKLYPESSADARFKISGVSKIFFYCNKDGLYYCCPKRF